jgi:DNA-binding NtrC family response regulator
MPRLPAVSGRILVGEDDERQRNALVAMLSDCDFDTLVASDGQEALERAIHYDGPFGAIDAAALPGTPIESGLFRRKKGAFTRVMERSAGMPGNHGAMRVQ